MSGESSQRVDHISSGTENVERWAKTGIVVPAWWSR